MPVPTAISALSQTAASNSPATTESPTSADDYLRQYSAFIAMLRDGIGFTDPVQLASAATTSIGAQNSLFVEITGTTTITSFGTSYEGPRFLRFTGALVLTHNATTLNLPGAANITTAAGDTCVAIPNYAGNGWNVVQYQRANGTPLALATQANMEARSIDKVVTPDVVKYDPGVAKVTCVFGGATGSSAGGFGLTSVTRNGAGEYTLVMSTAMSSTNYIVVLGMTSAGFIRYEITNASTFKIYTRNAADTAQIDPTSVSFAVFGDQ